MSNVEKFAGLAGIIIGASLYGRDLVPWWGMAIVMLAPLAFFAAKDRFSHRSL